MRQRLAPALRRPCTWGQPIQDSRGSFVLVLLEPVTADAPRLLPRRPQPALEAPSTKHAVHARVMPVLPRAPRLNTVRLPLRRVPPGRHPVRHALWPVVTLHVAWSPGLRQQPLQALDDILGGDRPSTLESQPLSGLLLQARQALQPPSIGGLVLDTGLAPAMMGRRRPGRRGRARAHGAPLARCPDDLPPRVLPDAAARLAIHPPLLSLSQGVQFPIAKAPIARRECMQAREQRDLGS
jgi:hypothetical protein